MDLWWEKGRMWGMCVYLRSKPLQDQRGNRKQSLPPTSLTLANSRDYSLWSVQTCTLCKDLNNFDMFSL